MPLTNCPSCNHQVSPSAISCPNCGQPLQGLASVTVEKTSKSLKKQRLVAVLLMLGGIVVLFVSGASQWALGTGLGFLAIVVGLVWNLVVTAKKWWHHD